MRIKLDGTVQGIPTVSIVIPCYNTHGHIEQAVESVRNQLVSGIEIIVVDDGSDDPATIAVLDRLDTEVVLVRQENRGLAAARNAGFRRALGEFVLPLDSDDWLEVDAVGKLMAALRTRADASFSFAHIRLEGEGRGVLEKNFNFFEQMFLNQLPYCLLLRKEAWARVGGYDESMRRGYEDWEFNVRLGRHGCFGVVVPEPLFHYRVAQTGMLLSTSSNLHGQLWWLIRRKNSPLYELGNLVGLWRKWRHFPSTYPLWWYFPWLVVAHVLPSHLFTILFKALRRRSQSRKVTAALARQR